MESLKAALAPRAGSPTALAELLFSFRTGRRARATGLHGASRGYALAHLARALKRPLVCVEPDEEAAEALERDLRFFWPPSDADKSIVRLPGDEVLPYEGLTPDPQAAMARLAGLFHLHLGSARVVVLSVRGLARRVLPREALDSRSLQLAVEATQDRDDLAAKLTAAGYAKVPLVEDPGTFAVRGGVFDVWSPLDPQTQRSVRELSEVSLCPAREIVLDEAGRKAAIATVRAAADAVETPTRRLRELIDELQSHSQDDALFAAGLSAILPGFYPGGLKPVTDYLPAEALWVLDDPLELERQWGELWTELQASFAAARGKGELALPPDQHYLHERDVRPTLDGAAVLELGGLGFASDAAAGVPEIDFALKPTAELRAEIAGHHGEDGALAPLVRRLADLRDRGIAALVACHSSAQAERARRLLLDRQLMARIVPELPPEPSSLFDPAVHAHLVTGEISAGFVDEHDRFALYSDEDIFGPRARPRRAARRPRYFGEDATDFRDLKEGDLVVHVEHGIARYDGLTRLEVRGFAADFLLLQFAGKDRLYVPVNRLRQIQKYVGGDPAKTRLDSLKSQTFLKRKARVKEELLKMAAELLDIYAARAAHQGYAFTPPDNMYRTFEADFEFDETPDQAKAIEDVLADMQKPRPMDRLVCGEIGRA